MRSAVVIQDMDMADGFVHLLSPGGIVNDEAAEEIESEIDGEAGRTGIAGISRFRRRGPAILLGWARHVRESRLGAVTNPVLDTLGLGVLNARHCPFQAAPIVAGAAAKIEKFAGGAERIQSAKQEFDVVVAAREDLAFEREGGVLGDELDVIEEVLGGGAGARIDDDVRFDAGAAGVRPVLATFPRLGSPLEMSVAEKQSAAVDGLAGLFLSEQFPQRCAIQPEVLQPCVDGAFEG